MSFFVFLLVLAAALFHASWNAMVKGNSDKSLGMAMVIVGQMLPAGLVMCFYEWPGIESIYWFMAGIIFHFFYQVLLIRSYKAGDFTQVYPIARGTAPMLVTLISVFVLGETFSTFELAGIALIIAAIFSLGISRQTDGARNFQAAATAVLTGCCIAGYSLSDGLGARVSPSSLGYISLLMFINGGIFAIYLAINNPGTLSRLVKTEKTMALLSGTASFAAYLMVVWAFTQAPIALVTALRETSILFAILIGIFIFKERASPVRIAAVLIALCGLALLRLSAG